MYFFIAFYHTFLSQLVYHKYFITTLKILSQTFYHRWISQHRTGAWRNEGTKEGVVKVYSLNRFIVSQKLYCYAVGWVLFIFHKTQLVLVKGLHIHSIVMGRDEFIVLFSEGRSY